MAYLDWSQAEDECVEATVARGLQANPSASKRRGTWINGEEPSVVIS